MSVGMPYEAPPISGLVVDNGDPGCFAIDFPGRAMLYKIIVVEIGGSGSFTVTVFNSELSCGGGSESDVLGDEVGPLPDDIYRVTKDLAGTAGKLFYFADNSTGGSGYVYRNQDKGKDGNKMGFPRKLYLRIQAGDNHRHEYAAAIAGLIYE